MKSDSSSRTNDLLAEIRYSRPHFVLANLIWSQVLNRIFYFFFSLIKDFFKCFADIYLTALGFPSCLCLQYAVFVVKHCFKSLDISFCHYFSNPTTSKNSLVPRIVFSALNNGIDGVDWNFFSQKVINSKLFPFRLIFQIEARTHIIVGLLVFLSLFSVTINSFNLNKTSFVENSKCNKLGKIASIINI